MGGGIWSTSAATARTTSRATSTHKTILSSSSLDDSMNPRNAFRESRDSAEHPESNAIGVIFDVTGSMGAIPGEFAKSLLTKLMNTIVTANVIKDPQIVVGAIGDEMCDKAPFQIGQFESDDRIDEWLTKVYLEGGGGGNNGESYALAPYFFAHHTSIDCFEKRGKKGYLFIIGDEPCITSSYRNISNIFGGEIPEDLKNEQIDIRKVFEEAAQKYEIFKICIPTGGYRDGSLLFWKDILDERAILLEDYHQICDFIIKQIGMMEQSDMNHIDNTLMANGTTSTALATINTKVMVPTPTSKTVAVVKEGLVANGSKKAKIAKD